LKGFDCNTKLSAEKALQFKQQGYGFAIRYVGRLQQASFDIDQAEVNNILAAGLKLAIVQHCPKDGWIPTKDLGITYGQNAVKFSKEAGYNKGCIVYLDLEGVLPGTSKADIISFCNAWYGEVVKYYTPGIYIGFNAFLTSEELYKKLKFQHYWKSFSKVPDVYKRGYEMIQKAECRVNGIAIDPDEVAGDKLGNFPVFMEGVVYKKVWLTHVIELDPMQLKASLVSNKGSIIAKAFRNFVNANFFSGKNTIGWLISEGKVLNERHEYKTWRGNRKGTLVIYKDGKVEAGLRYDSDIAPVVDKIWFCCQGFNLFPLDIAKEGFDPATVGYKTNRVSIGYNKATNKIIIAVRPSSDSKRAVQTMKNLGCEGAAICLDSGGSVNLNVNNKLIYKTDRQLTNIIHW